MINKINNGFKMEDLSNLNFIYNNSNKINGTVISQALCKANCQNPKFKYNIENTDSIIIVADNGNTSELIGQSILNNNSRKIFKINLIQFSNQERIKKPMDEKLLSLDPLKDFANEEILNLFIFYQIFTPPTIHNLPIITIRSFKRMKNNRNYVLDSLIKALNDEIKKINLFIKKIERLDSDLKFLEKKLKCNDINTNRGFSIESQIRILFELELLILANAALINKGFFSRGDLKIKMFKLLNSLK